MLPHHPRPMDAWSNVVLADEVSSMWDGHDGEACATASISYVQESYAWSLHISWLRAPSGGTAAHRASRWKPLAAGDCGGKDLP